MLHHQPLGVGRGDALSTRLVASFVTVLFFVDVFSIGVYVCLHQQTSACLGTFPDTTARLSYEPFPSRWQPPQRAEEDTNSLCTMLSRGHHIVLMKLR